MNMAAGLPAKVESREAGACERDSEPEHEHHAVWDAGWLIDSRRTPPLRGQRGASPSMLSSQVERIRHPDEPDGDRDAEDAFETICTFRPPA